MGVMTSRACSVDDCDKPHHSRGWCKRHYVRWLRHGDPLAGGPLIDRPSGVCSIEGCDRRYVAHGFCVTHYDRWRTHGDPLHGGEVQPVTREVVGYHAAHYRVRNARGPADQHACVDCGRTAVSWSYDHNDPSALVEDGAPYSLDPSHYDPRCGSCHQLFDRAHSRGLTA